MQMADMIRIIQTNDQAAIPADAVSYFTPVAAGPTVTGVVDMTGASSVPSLAFVVDCPCQHECGEGTLAVFIFSPTMMDTLCDSLAQFKADGYTIADHG